MFFFQSLQLERLAMYHDSSQPPWMVDKKWEDLSPKDWVEVWSLFLAYLNSCNGSSKYPLMCKISKLQFSQMIDIWRWNKWTCQGSCSFCMGSRSPLLSFTIGYLGAKFSTSVIFVGNILSYMLVYSNKRWILMTQKLEVLREILIQKLFFYGGLCSSCYAVDGFSFVFPLFFATPDGYWRNMCILIGSVTLGSVNRTSLYCVSGFKDCFPFLPLSQDG